MFKKMTLPFVLLAILSGCAATGPLYSNDIENRATPLDQARMTIYRPGGSAQGAARSVRLKLDETNIGNVDYKGFNIFEIEAGEHTLTADLWDIPGKCDVALNLLPNTEYYFQVLPRTASLVSGFAGGVLGMAVESGGKKCGGSFAIIPVEKGTALGELHGLRMTE
jgi:predicted small lipoprotein YifL